MGNITENIERIRNLDNNRSRPKLISESTEKIFHERVANTLFIPSGRRPFAIMNKRADSRQAIAILYINLKYCFC